MVLVASANGGMEIEELVETRPEALIRIQVEPAVGLCGFQARELAFALGLPTPIVPQAVSTFLGAYRAFRNLDATLVEINPLVLTRGETLVALDAKMGFDDNALFRRPHISELRDKSQEDPREAGASDRGLSYVGLDGNIGCMINGAGLAMATMDMIKLAGGEPANFLDIGGGATPERVAKAFRLVLSDENVEAMLVNIFCRDQSLRLGGRGCGAGGAQVRNRHASGGASRRHPCRGRPANSPGERSAHHHRRHLVRGPRNALWRPGVQHVRRRPESCPY